MKPCPKCKLVNPDSAERCDCGYDFESGQVKESYLPPAQPPKIKPHKTATGVAGLMSILALGSTYLREGDTFLAVGTAAIVSVVAYALTFGFQYIRLVIVRRKYRIKESRK